MRYRELGRTGMVVSEIGYGGWGIGGTGWIGADDGESKRALHRAIDLGLTFVDTAARYGDGHSERVIGQVLRERSERVYVASKVPPKDMSPDATADQAYPAGHIREYTERSLRNLGVETLDVQQLHRWYPGWLGEGEWQETVAELKDEGKIRHVGLSLNDHAPATGLDAVRSGVVDTVQVIYNVFDQSPQDALLPACAEHGVGVIVRVPLDEGALTGAITPESTFPDGDWRHRYFAGDRKREVRQHVQAILDDLDEPVQRLAEIALRFVLSDPAVSTVIPGMRTVANVERNMAVGDGQGLPVDVVEKLRKHRWVRNFYP